MHGMGHKIYPTKAYKIAQKAILFTLIQVRDSCVVCDVDMLTMNKIKILPDIASTHFTCLYTSKEF